MSRRGLRAAVAAGVLAASLALTACGTEEDDSNDSGAEGGGSAPELTTSGAFVPEPVSGDMAAGFLTISNTGGTDDTLVSVTSDVAGTVEIHETVDNAMRQVDGLTVPAGGEARLSRGGDHLMLLDLSRELVEGETVGIELHFETSDPIALDVPVEATTHTGE
ncbi:copper chaperone PCu(A)C [Streptomyces marincola]|uniref:Copper resistance protein CopZ n=1 Tax=Streptomyces marincola TaxID=2878388 RepID=A0A1W7CY63_9ACTN|nr:copper chaperone PCu(A)C [Streptomyces marincola]ARQ69686.1 copper resistance protein CopZ [Streptomyces marincola]